MIGTTLEVEVDRPVDGDTVRVFIDGKSEALRILALDTEESGGGGNKPITPWGREAKKHAEELFIPGKKITLEFPGFEPLEEAMERYRGNFGRLLVYIHIDGMDYQEHMIELGFSPYFNKYGNAHFEEYHDRYIAAERAAQSERIGVWDQVTVNGSEQRNYYVLGAWWALRAAVIDEYRCALDDNAQILNSRLDFTKIKDKAKAGEDAVVFTELRELRRVSSSKAIIDIGSVAQPFKVFIPDFGSDGGQALVNLLEERYVSGGSDGRTVTRPRRSYAYVSGQLKMFKGEPEIVVETADQLHDYAPV